jgi:ABC-type amino acid transport substrate-binding protein
MKWRLALCAALALAACDRLPRDPDGTLDRVRAERRFRVGLIATGGTPIGAEPESVFLARVARAAGAQPVLKEGASEPLLLELEDGRLDLVIGPLSPESPWVDRVALLRPIGETVAPQHLLLTPIARNGENRWIMLLEREARTVAAGERP